MLVHIYTKQCRSFIELAVSSENIAAFERVQKTACLIILGRNYRGSEDALKSLNLTSFESRREELCIKLAKKSVKGHWFVKAEKTGILTRIKKVFNGYIKRFRKSTLPYLTILLNRNS